MTLGRRSFAHLTWVLHLGCLRSVRFLMSYSKPFFSVKENKRVWVICCVMAACPAFRWFLTANSYGPLEFLLLLTMSTWHLDAFKKGPTPIKTIRRMSIAKKYPCFLVVFSLQLSPRKLREKLWYKFATVRREPSFFPNDIPFLVFSFLQYHSHP